MQLSSFLKVWPIPSHNLSGQLLNGGQVYSSLLTLLLGLDKNAFILILAKPCYVDKSLLCKFKHLHFLCFIHDKCYSIYLEWSTSCRMCTPWTLHCTGQAGHGRGQLLENDIAARAFGHQHEFFIYAALHTVHVIQYACNQLTNDVLY